MCVWGRAGVGGGGGGVENDADAVGLDLRDPTIAIRFHL